ncbi:phage capsid superfamily [Candidatus Termititenax aidoneus]|uniref:Phage capsid superfamily n=1 Tax=Termititenax aidoneus TaxID=2218524 RepID=A0A388TCK4_TERA1|nr:phage capsid superfamily [Candidatus Termititenax aidoneus]
MNELIKKLLLEGKSDTDIAAEVLKQHSKSTAKEITDAILAAKKSEEVLAALKSAEDEAKKAADEAAAKSEMQKQIDNGVSEALKKIKLDPLSGFAQSVNGQKEYFSHAKKKVIKPTVSQSEDQKAFFKSLDYIKRGDTKSLEALNKDIAAQKSHDYENAGVKAPLLSNVPTGNVLLPTEVENSIFVKAYMGVLLSRVNTNVITAGGKLYPVLAGLSYVWRNNHTQEFQDKTPTLVAPVLKDYQFGAMCYLDNELLAQESAGLLDAISEQAGSRLQEFADRNIVVAALNGGDPFDGIAFDAQTVVVAAKLLSAAAAKDLLDLKNALSPKFRTGAIYMANSTVRDVYGMLTNGAGAPEFTGFRDSANFRPFGKEYLENNQIPEGVDVAGKELDGEANINMCFDPSVVYVGFTPLLMAASEHFKFASDQLAIRIKSSIGSKVITGSADQGAAVAVQQLDPDEE